MITDDERAVRGLFEQTSAAWANGEAAAFADRYAPVSLPDASVTLPGVHLRGRDAIRAGMSHAVAGPLNASTRAHTIEHLRFLNSATRHPAHRQRHHLPSETTLPGGTAPPPGRWKLATWLLSRPTGGWPVESYRSSPAPALPSPSPRGRYG